MEHINNVKLSLFKQLAKVWAFATTTKLMKKEPRYQSKHAGYVTRQINSHILELLLRQFCLIFAPSEKFYMFDKVW